MFRFSQLVVVVVLATFIQSTWTKECIGVAVPDPEDCQGYYLILGGVKLQQYCAPGMKFDKDKGECIVGKCPPCDCENSNPGTETPTPDTETPSKPETDTPTPTEPGEDTPTPSEPGPVTDPDPSTTTTTMNPSQADCSNIPNGSFFAHADHCRLYWVCREGVPVLLHCEKGMWFDADNYVCNYPHLVDCPANID